MGNENDWGIGPATPAAMTEVEAMRVRPEYWWPVAKLEKRGIFAGRELVAYEVRVLGEGWDERPLRVDPGMCIEVMYRAHGLRFDEQQRQ